MPSLLEQHQAEEAQPVCGARRALLTAFTTAATLLIVVNVYSTAPTPKAVRASSHDIAVSVLKHRTLMPIPDSATSKSDVQPPPPPSIAVIAGVSDATCHARLNTDYMGEQAPVWGLGNPGFHLKDAAECCAACQAHARVCGRADSRHKSWWPARPELKCGANPGCNLWVFCPEKQCFAFDIHVHTFGECWLKQQRTLLKGNITSPKDPHEGQTFFPQSMRKSPRNVWPWAVDPKIWPGGIPERVPWISGVLAPADAVVRSAAADDPWRRRWCEKHGPKYGGCDA